MDTKNFLNNVCKEIKYNPVKQGIAEELKLHIQEMKEEYINNGMNEAEAEEKAVSQMGEAEEIGKQLNKIHRPKLDWKLLFLILLLIGFSFIVTISKDVTTGYSNFTGRQITNLLVGVILGVFIYFFDYRKLKKYSNLIYAVATGILILGTTKISNVTQGLCFVNIGICSFMPAIVSVPLYIIAFIGYILEYNKENVIKIEDNKSKKRVLIYKNIFKIVLASAFSVILIAKVQSIVYSAILSLVYLVIITVKGFCEKQGKKLLYIYIPIIILTICFAYILAIRPGGAYRMTRVTASFYPEIDPDGSGYVGMLQKDILENAELIGTANTKIINDSRYIINERSNYTFIYLLGKTGILVAGILVITIILTSLKLMINAKSIKEQYGKFLIIGLSTLYIIQSFATILMNINMGVQINIDLPFVTFGGVYLLVNSLSIAIILSVYRRKDINEYDVLEENSKIEQ